MSSQNYKYKASFVVGHKPDGKPIRKYIQDNSKAKFDAKVRALKALTDRGGTPNKFTVEQWAWQWYHIYKEPHIGASQRNTYEAHFRLRICPQIGAMALADVKPYRLQQLINEATTDDGKPLSASTAEELRYIIRGLFEQAEINGLIPTSPTRKLEISAEPAKKRRSLTQDEERIVREVAKKHYAGPWVLLMLDCGLRRGETVAIGANDIKDGLLRISRAVEYKTNSNQATIKEPKSESGVRFVPIPAELIAQLNTKTRYFFLQKDGTMLTQTNLRRMWSSFHRACDRAAGAKIYRNKIIEHAFAEDITPHYLRHTYCTNLYRQGVDLKTAQYLMGHADISTTANIYSHVTEEDVRNITAKKGKNKGGIKKNPYL